MAAKKIKDLPPTKYYDLIYKTRADYTSHFIPTRIAIHNKKRELVFYLEAYLIAPSIPAEDPSSVTVENKIISLPEGMKNEVRIRQDKIYPTGRLMTKLDPKTLKEVSAIIGEDHREFWPKPLKWLERTRIELLKTHPGAEWTLDELQSLLGRGPSDLASEVDLGIGKYIHKTENTRKCRITTKTTETYTLEKPMTKTTTLIEKRRSLAEIEKEYESCTRCPLGDIRRSRHANLVFGRGSETATGMIIAESPWEQEERDKIPLHPSAPAGGVLAKIMQEMKLVQHEWYLTNAVVCRPLKNPGAPLSANKPSVSDIRACSTRLKETLRRVSPKLVVLMGAVAYRAWFGKDPEGVLKTEGWVSVPHKHSGKVVNYHVYFIRHPSYVARSLGTSGEERCKKEYREHWMKIARKYKEL